MMNSEMYENNFQFTSELEEKAKKAAKELKADSSKEFIVIPESLGMVLVKKGTAAAKERLDENKMLAEQEIDGESYFVCSS